MFLRVLNCGATLLLLVLCLFTAVALFTDHLTTWLPPLDHVPLKVWSLLCSFTSVSGFFGSFRLNTCLLVIHALSALVSLCLSVWLSFTANLALYWPPIFALVLVLALLLLFGMRRRAEDGEADGRENREAALDHNQNPVEKKLLDYSGPKSEVAMKWIDED